MIARIIDVKQPQRQFARAWLATRGCTVASLLRLRAKLGSRVQSLIGYVRQYSGRHVLASAKSFKVGFHHASFAVASEPYTRAQVLSTASGIPPIESGAAARRHTHVILRWAA